jgi:hypothetical protein
MAETHQHRLARKKYRPSGDGLTNERGGECRMSRSRPSVIGSLGVGQPTATAEPATLDARSLPVPCQSSLTADESVLIFVDVIVVLAPYPRGAPLPVREIACRESIERPRGRGFLVLIGCRKRFPHPPAGSGGSSLRSWSKARLQLAHNRAGRARAHRSRRAGCALFRSPIPW